jgi:hypothetical protein
VSSVFSLLHSEVAADVPAAALAAGFGKSNAFAGTSNATLDDQRLRNLTPFPDQTFLDPSGVKCQISAVFEA